MRPSMNQICNAVFYKHNSKVYMVDAGDLTKVYQTLWNPRDMIWFVKLLEILSWNYRVPTHCMSIIKRITWALPSHALSLIKV